MSSLFDRLEDQLRAAAQAQIAARAGATPAPGHPPGAGARRLWTWLSAGGRLLPVGLALASTVAVVVAALVLLHPGRTAPHSATPPPGGGPGSTLPLPGSPLARRELHQIQRLLAPVQRSAACHVTSTLNGRPSTLPGRPGQALLRELAVLRRPSTRADHVPIDLALGGVVAYIHDVQLARVSDGASIFVAPIRVQPAAGQPSVRCMDAEVRAVRRHARSIPASIRAQTVHLVQRLLAYARRMITTPPYDSVCVIEMRGRGSSSDCGSATLRALVHIAVPPLDSGSPLRRPAYIAAVPNGVASATLSLAPFDGHPATTLRGTAAGNVLVIPAPRWLGAATRTLRAGQAPPEPTHMEWRDHSGRVIAHLAVPRNISRTFCSRHRLECLLGESLRATSGSGTSGSGTATATTASRTATSPPSQTTTTRG